MPKQLVWKPWCPLGGICKYANKHMGRFYEVDQAKRRLRDHLRGSVNHDLNEREADEEVDKFDFEQCKEEETWEDQPPEAAVSSGSRSAASKSHGRPPKSEQRRSRSRSGRRSPLRRGPQLTLTGPALQGTVTRIDESQQDTIFKLAKAMGKCDAVIRTAARVCKQAALSLEDRVLFLLR